MPNYDPVINTVKEQVVVKAGKKGFFRRIAERIGLVQKEVEECKGKTLSEMAEMTSKKDAVELSKDARKVPYCLDTSIHDNFIPRIPTGDFKRTAVNMKQAQEVKNIVEKDIESETCKGVLLDRTYRTDVAKAFAEEAELPLYKITPQDWIDKKTGKEYVGEAENYIRKVTSQLEQKFKNTGERSVLLIQDIDKICSKDAVGPDKDKCGCMLLTLLEAKSYGIIPVMTTSAKEKVHPAILKRLKVVE